MAKQPAKYDTGNMFLELPPEQEQALRYLNRIIVDSNNGDERSGTCLGSRLSALAEYCNGQRSVLSLFRAFKALYPHWGPYNNMTPVKNIKFIFSKVFSSGWIPYGQAVQYRITTASRQSKDNLTMTTIDINVFLEKIAALKKEIDILTGATCILFPEENIEEKLKLFGDHVRPVTAKKSALGANTGTATTEGNSKRVVRRRRRKRKTITVRM